MDAIYLSICGSWEFTQVRLPGGASAAVPARPIPAGAQLHRQQHFAPGTEPAHARQIQIRRCLGLLCAR
eukprot:6381696-Pyramimonas_sp.AAC.1